MDFIVGKLCMITYKDSGECSRLVNYGECLSYYPELITIKDHFTGRVEAISTPP